MLSEIAGYTFEGESQINVLVGKNGCGKSRLLRDIDTALQNSEETGVCKYVTPERGGTVTFAAGIEQSVGNDPLWMSKDRRKNQTGQFKQQSVALFRDLEKLVLRRVQKAYIEGREGEKTFDSVIEQINGLLDNIQVRADGSGLEFVIRESGDKVRPEHISSGESELIALAIECLSFAEKRVSGKENYLLLDEPDVHLHPDLQHRLANMICSLAKEADFRVILATHSTAMLASLASSEDVAVAFMKSGEKHIRLQQCSEVIREIVPVFGAHPLSEVFNESKLLLVEGEDDVRIWRQVQRSSNSRIRLYPVAVDGIGNLGQYESAVVEITAAIYDSPRAYSLRDRDDSGEEIADMPPLIRMKLACRASENLFLTDEVLELLGTTWADLKTDIISWRDNNEDHEKWSHVKSFADSEFDRKGHDLKEIRNVLRYIIGTNKEWEVAIGQAMGTLDPENPENQPGSLYSFLGDKVVQNLLR